MTVVWLGTVVDDGAGRRHMSTDDGEVVHRLQVSVRGLTVCYPQNMHQLGTVKTDITAIVGDGLSTQWGHHGDR